MLTGETLTPDTISWLRQPSDTVQFPFDTVRFPASPDSLRIQWTPVDAAGQYMLTLRILDTLDYGKYLTPANEQTNRRTPRLFGRGPRGAGDLIRWSLAPGTDIVTPWTSFRWYGPHELTVFAPDYNFFNWFRLVRLQQQRQYNELLGSINGGLGYFGSASILRKHVFVLKNQP